MTGGGILAGLPRPVAFIGAMGFVLTSTAVVMQMLEERGDTSTPRGQRLISILLLEDLAIVPLLAHRRPARAARARDAGRRWLPTSAIAARRARRRWSAGRWLLNPLFRLLAAARAREVMTAAALLVVLGAAC